MVKKKRKSTSKKTKDSWEYPTIQSKECSTIAMTAGNEKKFRKVIHDGVLKEWVGIGWIPIKDNPDYFDKMKHPTVVD